MMRTFLAAMAIVLVWTIGLAPERVWAADTTNKSPIEITSERMVSESGGQKIVFSGQVVARQDDTTLYCEEMHVFQGAESKEVERIEAYRQVRVVQGERVATGDQGTFYQQERKVVLRGNARVVSGQDQVEGETITFFLDRESSQVEASEGGRVKAIFFPKSEEQ